jgi:hypothetical protein
LVLGTRYKCHAGLQSEAESPGGRARPGARDVPAGAAADAAGRSCNAISGKGPKFLVEMPRGCRLLDSSIRERLPPKFDFFCGR